MINATLWVSRSGAPWRDLPSHHPKWKSVHTRFLRWSKSGKEATGTTVLADKGCDANRRREARARQRTMSAISYDAHPIRSSTTSLKGQASFNPLTLHTCQRRKLVAALETVEEARKLLEREVEMLTRLVRSTVQRDGRRSGPGPGPGPGPPAIEDSP
jgi:transposase